MEMDSVGGNLFQSLSISASGIRDATIRMNVVANNIANANTDGFIPNVVSSSARATGGVDTSIQEQLPSFVEVPDIIAPSQSELVTEFANLILAKNAFQANAKALTQGDQAMETIVNTLG